MWQSFFRQREKDTECTAPAEFAINSYDTIVGLYNSQNYCQSHTTAGEFICKKRVKELLNILILNAASCVSYFQTGTGAILRLPVYGETMRRGDFCGRNCFNAQGNGASVITDSFPGISEQVG